MLSPLQEGNDREEASIVVAALAVPLFGQPAVHLGRTPVAAPRYNRAAGGGPKPMEHAAVAILRADEGKRRARRR